MAVRIYEISKKWGMKSADLVDRCEELGIDAASHMSAIEDSDVLILAKNLVRHPITASSRKKAAAKKAAAKKAAAKKAAEEKAAAEMAVAEKAAAEEQTPAPEEIIAAPEPEAPGAADVARTEAAPAPEAPAPEAPPAESEAAPEPVAAQEKPAVEKLPAETEAAPAAARPAGKHSRRAKPKPPKEEPKVAVFDEKLLKEQMERAAREVEKETKKESNIVGRIILPPRKKRGKKKPGTRSPGPRLPRPTRLIIAKKPERIELQSPVGLRGFSQASGIKTSQIIRKLMDSDIVANVNQVLEDDTVEMLGAEFGVEVILKKAWTPKAELLKIEQEPSDPAKLKPRSPVVALLGHVDHGKTSLLDAVRHSDVTSGEFGGITQHMGAYQVRTDSGHTLTFLDTPGHEAFTEMRARGAHATDIVILVVAADDGVMPQTIEAINHAKAAGVPMVVVINKIDKPDAQPERVKRQLTEHGLLPEDWGGDLICVPVSATTGAGIDNLLEMIALQSEMMELKADPDRPAIGTVIEARRTEGKGIVATVLVQSGTLKPGDIMVAGVANGRIRSMADEHQGELLSAGPSVPVEVSGLNDIPDAGERFYVVESLQKAREIADTMASDRRDEGRAVRQRVSMENLLATIQEAGAQQLEIVLKTDVQGTLEVLTRTLVDLSVPEVKINIIHGAVGSISESDVLLADASNAIIVGFNVVAENSAREQTDRKGIEIRLYNIIYRLIEDMRAALENRLAPEIREIIRGHAEVRDIFRISRLGTIAGCRVTDGIIPRRATLRVARGGIVVYEGSIDNLKHFKDDVREVREGFECGIKIAGYDDVKVGDVLEAFETEEVARKLP